MTIAVQPDAFQNTAFQVDQTVNTSEMLGAGSYGRTGGKKRKRKKPLRWSEYADAEERRQALAQALAEASIPLSAVRTADGDIEGDSIIEEEDALIMALALVISRRIH